MHLIGVSLFVSRSRWGRTSQAIKASSFKKRIIAKVDGRSANSHAGEGASLRTITQMSLDEWKLRPKIQNGPSVANLTGA
jgi:hypothetical protein